MDDPGLIDYERAWRALKAKLSEKKSWGQRELYEFIVQAEVESMHPASSPKANGHRKQPLRSAS